jgi:hypothetical protein
MQTTISPASAVSTHGLVGWAVLGSLVVAWDVWAVLTDHETLSGAYSRAMRSRAGRVATTAATAYMITHLQGWPRSLHHLDPLNVAGSQLRRLRPLRLITA